MFEARRQPWPRPERRRYRRCTITRRRGRGWSGRWEQSCPVTERKFDKINKIDRIQENQKTPLNPYKISWDHFVTKSSAVHSFSSGPAERISISVPESWWKKKGVPQ